MSSVENEGFTGYMDRHNLRPGELQIRILHKGKGKVMYFDFYHRDKFVKRCSSRSEVLEWMRGETPQAEMFDNGSLAPQLPWQSAPECK